MNKIHHEGKGAIPKSDILDFDIDMRADPRRSAFIVRNALSDRMVDRDMDDFTGEMNDGARKELFKIKYRKDRKVASSLYEKAKKSDLRDSVEGEAFEMMMNFASEGAAWFGGDVFQTELFDDVVNGVDAVVEWEAEDGDSFKLAIDYTVSSNQEDVSKKFMRRKSGARVNYFLSEFDDEYVQDVGGLPKVVLGIDRRMFSKVALPILDKKKEEG